MQDLTKEQLLNLTKTTLLWGRDVSEMWTGTSYEEQIANQERRVEDSLEHEDYDKVRDLVSDLAQFLEQAEREYDGHPKS